MNSGRDEILILGVVGGEEKKTAECSWRRLTQLLGCSARRCLVRLSSCQPLVLPSELRAGMHDAFVHLMTAFCDFCFTSTHESRYCLF